MFRIKKTITIFLILFATTLLSYAQNLSYGIVLGASTYDIEIKGNISGGTAYSKLNYGVFSEYNFNESFGLKLNLILNKTREKGYSEDIGIGSVTLFDEAELSTIQALILLKYDLNKKYRKGFYLTSGFRLTSISDIESEYELDEFYKKSSFGILLGVGTTFLKHFSLELLIDYNLTNTIDSEENKAKNLGAYVNLMIDLESIFKKN